MSDNQFTQAVPGSKKDFCVHGHFYQPPREDPFTGKIPIEYGAFPFPNYNEKIYDQCYRPNAELGNFSRISFDIGPTLASWLESEHLDTYLLILAQEHLVYEWYGVSNAMAQSYNHSILPLATRADKVTQVRWGIIDYEYRFGHKPLGMWLPETAVDMESLEVLYEEGIRYTILAPWQARAHNVDVTHPYWVDLGNDRRFYIFYYNADLSMKVSFMPEATVNADGFVYEELLPLYPDRMRNRRYHIIASDGELYGHHQPFRDKFLEWLTTGSLDFMDLDSVFPEMMLKLDVPIPETHIRDNTSWSCHHGIKRWASECECAEHGKWKRGMRSAFNRIAEFVDEEMEKALAPYGLDLLTFRNEYAYVLTGQETAEEQLARLVGRELPDDEKQKLLMLMQAQYERQRMFTSCGWFFGDFERLEARNNLAYAAMAMRLLTEVTGNQNYYNTIYHMLYRVESETSGVRASTYFAKSFHRGL